MRTPGRCTNFETCWLANGRRDIRVLVCDSFDCPACGAPLQAPPIEAISNHGMASALAACLALAVTAGGAGYGMIPLLESFAGPADPAGASASHQGGIVEQASLAPARAMRTAAPAQTRVVTAPAVPTETRVMLASVPVPAMQVRQPVPATDLSAVIAVVSVTVAEPAPETAVWDMPVLPPVAPVHTRVFAVGPMKPLVLPISFGRPVAPEDDYPARGTSWHHRGFAVRHRTGFVRTRGWSPYDDQTVQQAVQSVPPIEGDNDDGPAPSSARNDMPVPDGPVDTAPAQTADNAPPPAEPSTEVPYAGSLAWREQADTAAPSSTSTTTGPIDSGATATQITRLIVRDAAPATLPTYQPAARVDPAAAAQLDRATDAPLRLAVLAPATPDKLAVPAYPPRQENADQPGRVDVGCVVTARGLPANCRVQHQTGGNPFAASVLTWLNSGTVRYRPSVQAGHPVAEPREYKVRFEP